MLTKEHAVADYDFQRQRILPDRLTSGRHAHYLAYAERMLDVYRGGAGRRRSDLHRDIHRIFADEMNCPLRRIEAFCKLLDEQSKYADAGRRTAPKLRQQVFRIAARHHPLVNHADQLFDHSVASVHDLIEKELQKSWFDIRTELFADVIENHLLETFEGYPDAHALLSRYNVAQLQVTLFRAISLMIDATSDFKRILRAARLAQLMHTISRTSDGTWRIQLDGPASVLRQTRRYGVQMARFLPALICCKGWKLHAVVETHNRWKLSLKLSDRDGLRSHLPPESEFDSSIEADFAKKWGEEARDGWTLEREAEVLYSGQKTFIPDFVFRRSDGRSVMLEIIGFWTPEYIAARRETLAVFCKTPILLAIHESTSHHFASVSATATIVTYKSTLQVKTVLQALARFVDSSDSGGQKRGQVQY